MSAEMSDKLDAGPYWGNSNLPPKWNEPAVIMVEQPAWEKVHRERDELRAENKALEDQAFDLTERLLQCSTENERLRAGLQDALHAIDWMMTSRQPLSDITSASTLSPLLVPIASVPALLGGLSRSKVFEYLADGSLPSLTIGRRRFVRVTELETFVERLSLRESTTSVSVGKA